MKTLAIKKNFLFFERTKYKKKKNQVPIKIFTDGFFYSLWTIRQKKFGSVC
jgi:hypothetical protein